MTEVWSTIWLDEVVEFHEDHIRLGTGSVLRNNIDLSTAQEAAIVASLRAACDEWLTALTDSCEDDIPPCKTCGSIFDTDGSRMEGPGCADCANVDLDDDERTCGPSVTSSFIGVDVSGGTLVAGPKDVA
jgi:hypothetical protein